MNMYVLVTVNFLFFLVLQKLKLYVLELWGIGYCSIDNHIHQISVLIINMQYSRAGEFADMNILLIE